MRLPGAGKVDLAADVILTDTGETDRIAFSSMPKLFSDGHHIQFKQVEVDGELASQALTESLVKTLNQLLDLRNFTLSGYGTAASGDGHPGEADAGNYGCSVRGVFQGIKRFSLNCINKLRQSVAALSWSANPGGWSSAIGRIPLRVVRWHHPSASVNQPP